MPTVSIKSASSRSKPSALADNFVLGPDGPSKGTATPKPAASWADIARASSSLPKVSTEKQLLRNKLTSAAAVSNSKVLKKSKTGSNAATLAKSANFQPPSPVKKATLTNTPSSSSNKRVQVASPPRETTINSKSVTTDEVLLTPKSDYSKSPTPKNYSPSDSDDTLDEIISGEKSIRQVMDERRTKFESEDDSSTESVTHKSTMQRKPRPKSPAPPISLLDSSDDSSATSEFRPDSPVSDWE